MSFKPSPKVGIGPQNNFPPYQEQSKGTGSPN